RTTRGLLVLVMASPFPGVCCVPGRGAEPPGRPSGRWGQGVMSTTITVALSAVLWSENARLVGTALVTKQFAAKRGASSASSVYRSYPLSSDGSYAPSEASTRRYGPAVSTVVVSMARCRFRSHTSRSVSGEPRQEVMML